MSDFEGLQAQFVDEGFSAIKTTLTLLTEREPKADSDPNRAGCILERAELMAS